MGRWPDDDSTRAVLARTNRELIPAVVVAMAAGIPFRAARLELPLEDPGLDAALAEVLERSPAGEPLLRRSAGAGPRRRTQPRERSLATLLAWAPPFADLAAFIGAIEDARRRLAELRRDDAALTLATAHATKGLEFDHVVVLGMEAARFPSARAVDNALDPARAYEEERRLAYVAWTRARRSLTLLYDPAVPSPFLLEAFSAEELGLSPASG